MLGKHSLSTANAYDTEALEDALEGACGGNIKIIVRILGVLIHSAALD